MPSVFSSTSDAELPLCVDILRELLPTKADEGTNADTPTTKGRLEGAARRSQTYDVLERAAAVAVASPIAGGRFRRIGWSSRCDAALDLRERDVAGDRVKSWKEAAVQRSGSSSTMQAAASKNEMADSVLRGYSFKNWGTVGLWTVGSHHSSVLD